MSCTTGWPDVGVAVIVYLVTDPLDGATNETCIDEYVIVFTDKSVGGDNIVVFTILADLEELIWSFMAITHISYDIPLCKLSIRYNVWGCVNSLETVSPSTGLANTVYLFTCPADSVNEMAMDEFVLSTYVTFSGGNNSVLYTNGMDAAELILSIIAKIVIVYNIPDCNPVIVYEVDGALKFCGVIAPYIDVAVILYVSIVPGGSVKETDIVVDVLFVYVKLEGGGNNVL
jgi:hypothetical protein